MDGAGNDILDAHAGAEAALPDNFAAPKLAESRPRRHGSRQPGGCVTVLIYTINVTGAQRVCIAGATGALSASILWCTGNREAEV